MVNTNFSGKIHVPVLYGEKLLNNKNNKFKCIVMSHGMGGSRFMYSKICYDLASYGFVILALEHK